MNKTLNKTVVLIGLLVGLSSAFAKNVEYISDSNQQFDVTSDGRNSYISAMPGLIIRGATADGDRLIVAGSPNQLYGNWRGQPITLSKAELFPKQVATPVRSAEAAPTAAALQAHLARLENALATKEKDLAIKNGIAPVAASVPAVTKTASASISAPAPVTTALVPVITSKPVEPSRTWEIKRSDITLYGALTRWAETASPKRQLVFATEGRDYPAEQEASFVGDFDSAIADVMESYKYSNYPLRVCLWDNKPRPVVKVIHKNKRCED